MIRAVEIQNFQSHKYSLVKFSKGLNIIQGDNDVGKSAIIRALGWVLFNNLKGDYFRSKWGGDTKVKVIFDSGDVVERIRTDKENYYLVNGEKLFGFGMDVPDPVREICRVNDLNFQTQYDAVFLFSYSSSEATKLFNSIMRLDQMDEFLTVLNSKKKSVYDDLKITKQRIKELKELEKRFSGLEKYRQKLEKAEKVKKKIDELVVKRDKLESVIEAVSEVEEKEKVVKKFEEFIGKVSEAEKLELEIKELTEKKDRLEHILSEIDGVKIVDISDLEKKVNDLLQLEKTIEGLKGKVDRINELTFEITDYIDGIGLLNKKLKVLDKELHKFVGEKCPFCGRPIDETVVNK